jgi:hypothetical protein
VDTDLSVLPEASSTWAATAFSLIVSFKRDIWKDLKRRPISSSRSTATHRIPPRPPEKKKKEKTKKTNFKKK